MKNFIKTALINAISLTIIEYVTGGLGFPDARSVLATSIALGLINATIKPIVKVLTLPLNVLTFGLLTFVINGAILMFVVNYSGGEVSSLMGAIVTSLLLSFINGLVSKILKD